MIKIDHKILAGIVSIVIASLVLRTYLKNHNNLSIYMIIAFYSGFGWILYFLSAPSELNNYDQLRIIIILTGFNLELFLFIFTMKILEFKRKWIAIISTILAGLILIYLMAPQTHLYAIVSTILTILIFFLFSKIYLHNKDLKSLGLAISMIFLLLGEALKDIPGVSSNLAGSLLFI
ncbi:MAG: hypothetical protein ACTSVC_00460, partial [Promethearchaeota archaeon]